MGISQNQLLGRVDLRKGCGVPSGVSEHTAMTRGICREPEEPVSLPISGDDPAIRPK